MTKDKINKIVLAYSGGLDTSVMLRWLKDKYECEIVCYCADVGQGAEMDGLDTDVYDALIGGVDRHRANVAFKLTAPTLAGIIGTVEAVISNA